MKLRSIKRSKIFSQCRGKTRCGLRKGCMMTRPGERKSYCRKRSNKCALNRPRVNNTQCRGKSRCGIRKGCMRTRPGERKSYCRKRTNRCISIK